MEDFKCGKPVKGVEIMVVDDNLKEVPPNTKGNIMIKNNGFFLWVPEAARSDSGRPTGGGLV